MKKILRTLRVAVTLPAATIISLVVLLLLTPTGDSRASAAPVICDPVHRPENRDLREESKSNDKKVRRERPPVICDCIHLPPPPAPPPAE